MFAGILKTTTGTSSRTGGMHAAPLIVKGFGCGTVCLPGTHLLSREAARPPPKSSAGAKTGPPSGGPKPAYKEPPDTSCQSRPTGGQPKPVYKVPPSQGKGDAEKKTKPPPFGVKRPSDQSSGVREEDKQQSGAGGNPPKASATPPRPKSVPTSFFPRPKAAEPRPTSHQGATARSLSPTTRLRRPPAKLGPKGSARPRDAIASNPKSCSGHST